MIYGIVACIAFLIMLPGVSFANPTVSQIALYAPLIVIVAIVLRAAYVIAIEYRNLKHGYALLAAGILLACEFPVFHMPKFMPARASQPRAESVRERHTPVDAARQQHPPGRAQEIRCLNDASADIGAFNSALALYQVDLPSQRFPGTTLMQLYSDNATGWAGPYMATITNDPWGNHYTYTSSGSDYTIQSVHNSESLHDRETIRYVYNSGVVEMCPL